MKSNLKIQSIGFILFGFIFGIMALGSCAPQDNTERKAAVQNLGSVRVWYRSYKNPQKIGSKDLYWVMLNTSHHHFHGEELSQVKLSKEEALLQDDLMLSFLEDLQELGLFQPGSGAQRIYQEPSKTVAGMSAPPQKWMAIEHNNAITYLEWRITPGELPDEKKLQLFNQCQNLFIRYQSMTEPKSIDNHAEVLEQWHQYQSGKNFGSHSQR